MCGERQRVYTLVCTVLRSQKTSEINSVRANCNTLNAEAKANIHTALHEDAYIQYTSHMNAGLCAGLMNCVVRATSRPGPATPLKAARSASHLVRVRVRVRVRARVKVRVRVRVRVGVRAQRPTASATRGPAPPG